MRGIRLVASLLACGAAWAQEAEPPFRLEEAVAPPDSRRAAEPVPATPLDPAATAALLGRVRPLAPEPEPDQALRQGPPPPGTSAKSARSSFPPQAASEQEPEGPLEVVRFQPRGAVEVAPRLSVTFSRAMIALGAREPRAPVRITPEPPGRWRWLGTRTLVFEPEGGRFPMATRYAVEVPRGTRAVGGKRLAEPVRWSFTTPPPSCVATRPQGEQASRDPLFELVFDQRIDPAAVLPLVTVGSEGETFPLSLATDAKPERPERTLAFRAARRLPAGANVTIAVGPGAPSAEGPLLATTAHLTSFRTHPLLAVDGVHPEWYGDRHWRPAPGQPFQVRFTTPIEAASVTSDAIAIEPPVAGLRVEARWGGILVQGATAPSTSYTLAVRPGLRDRFGQTLAEEARIAFSTGERDAVLAGPPEDVVLDPGRPPRLAIASDGLETLRVRIAAVDPARDRAAFQTLRGKGELPGRIVLDEQRRVEGGPDAWTVTWIELDPALTNGLGHALVVVDPVGFPPTDRGPRRVVCWVQSTRLGVDEQIGPASLQAWVTSLATGEPVAGAEVTLAGSLARTDAGGLATLALIDSAAPLLVRNGADVALVPHRWWYRERTPQELRWYTCDDRHVYRPGEEVRIKGWVRRIDPAPRGGVLPCEEGARFQWIATSDADEELARGEVTLNRTGGFDLAFRVPESAPLGRVRVRFGEAHTHRVTVAEFRRPELEVQVEGDSRALGQATLAVRGTYFSGGPVSGSPVRWEVWSSPARFAPPGWSGWTFGGATSWRETAPDVSRLHHRVSLEGTTDPDGLHRLALRAGVSPVPLSIEARATLQDVNRQAWSARCSFLVHPADAYVGLRAPGRVIARGQPLALDVVVVGPDGTPIAGRPVELAFERVELEEGGSFERVRERHVRAVTSRERPLPVRLEDAAPGEWQVEATVVDAAGRETRTRTRLRVAGAQDTSRQGEPEECELSVDAATRAPGDVARVTVRAPFFPAEGLLTLRRSGLVRSERFRVTSPEHVLSLPIEAELIPGFVAHVALVGSATRDGVAIPAFAAGQVEIAVPADPHRLEIVVRPERADLRPGARTAVEVTVRDARGRPVPDAEVALMVVDDAVLALSRDGYPDPLTTFHARRSPAVWDVHSRELLQPPPPTPVGWREGSSAACTAAERVVAVPLRADLRPLALFAPELRSDERGVVRVELALPDSLTRWRATAIAAAGASAFGTGQATLTASLPLMVRPSPPRFLTLGDACELPVVVQNHTGHELVVDVALAVANLSLASDAGRRITVPARDRREVRFPVRADQRTGRARLQVVASAGEHRDAQELSIPVWSPGSEEAFATYGTLERGSIAQPIAPPTDVWRGTGGLEVRTSSTGLQALTDALIYLVDYPHGCAEQIASRVMALVAVREVLSAFRCEQLPSEEALDRSLGIDLRRLEQVQRRDGGWSFWAGDPRSQPWLSVHVAHALERARSDGHPVDPRTIERARRFLTCIEQEVPADWPREARASVIAYALHVRDRLGDPDPARARRLVSEETLARLSLEAQAWLLPTLRGADDPGARADAAAIRRALENRVTERAGVAFFTTGHAEQEQHLILASSRRTDAVVLEALLDDPAEVQGDLAPKLVQGLLAHRVRGRWLNTQENAFVLLALHRWFRDAEATEPDFVARAWLGQRFAGEHAFRGRTPERAAIVIPLAELSPERLVLAKEGPGRLYWRIGLSWVPKQLRVEPLDHGFAVERTYEAIDRAADVRRDPDGTWRVKAGARVRVTLRMVATERRLHVALVDRLPAGLEGIDPGLANTERLPPEAGPRSWRSIWWDHSGIRDDRAEAFTTSLREGIHAFSYMARATTPGTFTAPPARAEEMYAPETFGRSGSARVIVE